LGRIQFWISTQDGKDRIQLPVNPESLQVSDPYNYEDIEVHLLGEVTVHKARGNREVTLSSFLPRFYNPSYCEYTNVPNPDEVIKKLIKWRSWKHPVRFTVTGTDINFLATIRDFNYEMYRAGDDDIRFDLTLKEFRAIQVRSVETNTNGPTTGNGGGGSTRPGTRTPSSTYTVKSGDSLWKIAQRQYGKGSDWRKIYDANKSVIGKNPNLIYPGQKLVIPS
jgi:nucleoid-associated protein YgaU